MSEASKMRAESDSNRNGRVFLRRARERDLFDLLPEGDQNRIRFRITATYIYVKCF